MKEVTIGRSSGNDVVIGDSYVSGNHCRITADDVGGFSIVDNSTNGTFVNGQRIAKQVPVQLSPGDTVVIGNTTLPWQSYFGISASDGTVFSRGGTSYQSPPQYQQSQPKPNHPDNHLVWAILATLFCCLPLGIVAIVQATRVDRYWNDGDYQAAENAAKSAKQWIWTSAILGIIAELLYVVLTILGVLALPFAAGL